MSVLSPVPSAAALPDVANETGPAVKGHLDWVGMGAIHAPVTLAGENGEPLRFPARIDAAVDLQRGDVRGIHMSRLYLHLDRALGADILTPAALRRLLSVHGIGRAVTRPDRHPPGPAAALVSDNSGWKSISRAGLLEDGHFNWAWPAGPVFEHLPVRRWRQLIQRFRGFSADGQVDAASVLAWLGTERGSTPCWPALGGRYQGAAGARLRPFPSSD